MEHRRRRVCTRMRSAALTVEEGRGRHGRRLGAATARAHAHMRIPAHPCARARRGRKRQDEACVFFLIFAATRLSAEERGQEWL